MSRSRTRKAHLLDDDLKEMVETMKSYSNSLGTTKIEMAVIYSFFRNAMKSIEDDFLYLCRVNRHPSNIKTAMTRALFEYLDRFTKANNQ